MSKATLPIVQTKELKKFIVGDEIKIKYLKGHPRQYRFDASKGILNINGETPVTKPGKPFTIIPIAYRIFKDRLFNLSRREWLEIFFIDEKGAISVVMFHGYSVEAFLQMTQELFYEDLGITEIKVIVSPQQKESKSEKGGKYYIASFEYEEADREYLNTIETMITGQQIYRETTVKASNDMIVWEKYAAEIVEAEQRNGESEEATAKEN